VIANFSKAFCLVAAALMLIPGEILQAQEKGKVIILSPMVGETIDREERDYYGLFPASQNFSSAVIFQQSDGSHVAEITEEIKGTQQIRRRIMDQQTLQQFREHINAFETSTETYRRAVKNSPIIINKGLPLQMEDKLLGLKGNSILLGEKRPSQEFEPKRISLDEVHTITTKKSYALEGFLGGFFVGGITAAVIGANYGSESSIFLSPGDYAAIFAVIFAPLGGLVGLGIGSQVPKEGQRFELSDKSQQKKSELF
jgi:hypothetical protein